jgi:adenylate cyclase
VIVSGKVHQEVAGKLGLTFDDLGERRLKNIATPVQIYRLSATAPAARGATCSKTADSVKPSIAVLPFTNMSSDPEQEYFSDGITVDIITELSRFRSSFGTRPLTSGDWATS